MKKFTISIFFTCLLFNLYSQRSIQGIVKTKDGEVLAGANIHLKNSTTGTISDDAGIFKLKIPDGKIVLEVSYVGYGMREVQIEETMDAIEITLNEGIILRETVVTALNISRSEKSLGYSTVQIEGSDLEKLRDANIVNRLAGRAAGVTVQGSSGGNLGGSARITIRGIRSINGENQPLFVVDGIPMDNSNFTNFAQILGNGQGTVTESQRDYGNAIQDLNPDDIDNINILKGQAAAALYGSRGNNGVIMVTTKKGSKFHKNGIGVTLNSSLTLDKVSVFPKFQKRYGGGVDLLPRGYTDNSGFYKIPYFEISGGDTIGAFSSFDLVPIYGVDESSGIKFETSTDQHFQHLASSGNYLFFNGFGANQSNLYFRDWNTWDSWDTEHFGKSRLWEVGDDPIKFFETGVTSSHNLAFDGASDRFSFRLSYNRFDQKGIYPNSRIQRNTLSLNGSLNLNSNIQAFAAVNYVNSATTGRSAVTYDFRGGFNPAQNFSQWWHTQIRFDDLKQYQNPDGSMRTWNRQSAENPAAQYWDNPYWSRFKNYETDSRNRIFGNVGLTIKINNWLSATGRLLTDFYGEQREERVAFGSLISPQYTLDLINVNETNTDLILTSKKYFGDSFSLDAFLGGNKLFKKFERTTGATLGGLNIPDIYRLQNSKERPLITNTLTQKQIESFFSGATLGWKNMLYLDLTGRQDWSSTLPKNANGYFYPSASISYIFSEMMDIPKISFGKLRLGWAKVGGDTDPYNIYSTYNSNPNFGSLPSYTLSNTLNNLKLKPEQTSSVELGLDLRFFKDRFGLDCTIYNGTTSNQIIPLSTSTASGYERQFINAGEINNKGLEIDLHILPISTKDFSWHFAFNFGKNINKVITILPSDPSITNIPIAAPGGITINSFIGKPYGTILGTNYLYDDAGNKLIDPTSGNYLASPGVMPIGNILPKFTGGITNTFTWKNLSLNIFIDFRKGGDIFSFTNATGFYSGLLAESAEGDIRENGIINKGIIAKVDDQGNPILIGGGNTPDLSDDIYATTGTPNTLAVSYDDNKYFGGAFYIQKRYVFDGSFIKLREVAINLALNKTWLNKTGIQEASLSITGRNLLILYKNLPNLDPDMAISTNNIYGNEGGAVPSTRSIGLNINIKF